MITTTCHVEATKTRYNLWGDGADWVWFDRPRPGAPYTATWRAGVALGGFRIEADWQDHEARVHGDGAVTLQLASRHGSTWRRLSFALLNDGHHGTIHLTAGFTSRAGAEHVQAQAVHPVPEAYCLALYDLIHSLATGRRRLVRDE